MKANNGSIHTQARLVCAILASVGFAYGCGNDGGSGNINYECGSGLQACGAYCCAECNEDGSACKETSSDETGKRSCTSGQENCSGQCYNLKSDPKHCGSCDIACKENETCKDGACTVNCSDGYQLIDGQCYDTNIDSEHCGENNEACSAMMFCQKGVCTCINGLNADSQGNCIDAGSDKNNCGGEGNVCPGNMVCVEGSCSCPAGKFDCDGDDSNGCESTEACITSCPEGQVSCGTDCADLSSDKEHCGSCENACGTGMICEESECKCSEGTTLCGDACFALNTAQHCGNCDTVCNPTEMCVEQTVTTGEGEEETTEKVYSCVDSRTAKEDQNFSCLAVTDPEDPSYVEGAVDKTECWGECVDIKADAANCGACGNACKKSETCVEGVCEFNCAEGEVVCDDTCTSILTDRDHCGSCETACGSEEVCKAGKCIDKADEACEEGEKMCFGTCIDTMTDVKNCGSCLNACDSNEECIEGACIVKCTGDYSRCEVGSNVFACFNLENSATHCGACNSETSVCKDGQKCAGSQCTCDDGRYDCDGILENGCESTVSCECKPGETRKCWFGDEKIVTRDTNNELVDAVGACKLGVQTCDDSGKFWGNCEGAVYPMDYICQPDGITPFDITENADLNCNGKPDAEEACITKCDTKVSSTSYIGCEYWPVFLQNQAGYSTTTKVYFDLTLVISNPSSTETAFINVFNQAGQNAASPAPINKDPIEVAPGAVKVETLVGVPYGKYVFDNSTYTGTCADPSNATTCNNNEKNTSVNPENGLKVVDYMLHGTQQTANAFRVVSSEPVVVYQFNPYGKPETHSADASLLMPKSVLGKKYLTMGFDNDKQADKDRADAITIVAVDGGETKVKVTFKAATVGGENKVNGNKIAEQAVDSSFVYTLKQFEVLNLSQSTARANSTGTVIEVVDSDNRIEVFGGAGCGFVPYDQEACDHLEEQLFPTSTWGTEYAAVKTYIRNTETPEDDVYYILAQEDGTSLNVTGQVTPDKKTLGAGEKAVIKSSNNFYVKANKPILVGQFMVGSRAGAAGKGDPSFILNVPVQQYRTEYSFSVPSGYEADYVTIISPTNNTIKYTGAGCSEADAKYVENGVAYTDVDITTLPTSMFSGFMKHPNGKYQYGYLNLDGGTHSLTADKAFGVTGYGFFSDTSYGYPIGLDLKELNTN